MRSLIWRATFALVVACLVACASSIRERYPAEAQAIEQRDYGRAEALLKTRVARDGDADAFVLLGALYYDKMGRRDEGLRMLNYAARRGNEFAQHVLFTANEPVPPADLQPGGGGFGLMYCQSFATASAAMCLPLR